MARKAASLELAVLGLLHESPLHGYELRKRLNLLLGWGRLLSYGSLYPALKRMLRAGWITEVTAATPGVSRRQRIVYQITAGRHGVLRRARSPTSVRPRGRTTTSTCGSRSSPAPTPRSGCASSRGAGPGSRSGSTAPAHAGRAATTATQRAAAPRHRVRRARGPLAHRPDQRRASRDPHRAPPTDAARGDHRTAATPPSERRTTSGRRDHRNTAERRKDNPMGSVRVAIVGVGNCATSLIQGVEYYKDADPAGTVPGPDARRRSATTTSTTSSSSPRSTSTPRRSASTSPRPPSLREQHHPDLRRPADRRDRAARPHPRRPRQVLPRDHRGVRRRAGRRRRRSSRTPRPTCSSPTCPVGSEQADKFYAQCAIDAGVAFVNALPVFIASDPVWAKKFEDAGVPIIGDDIKSPGRRDHHPPRDGQAVRGPRRRAGPHLPAQRRRQHGLQEHARARPPGVQEGLQDPVRDLEPDRSAGRQDPRPQRAHRPVRLRGSGSTTASGPTSASRVARSATCR